jgi:hypothetical protein
MARPAVCSICSICSSDFLNPSIPLFGPLPNPCQGPRSTDTAYTSPYTSFAGPSLRNGDCQGTPVRIQPQRNKDFDSDTRYFVTRTPYPALFKSHLMRLDLVSDRESDERAKLCFDVESISPALKSAHHSGDKSHVVIHQTSSRAAWLLHSRRGEAVPHLHGKQGHMSNPADIISGALTRP